ncbi:mRNA decay activator protein ZFP36 isoform X2 [Echeneis naucrates]|uniref:mRNA decay activator protein ZFP36 isoform X2 n=1 Tax=Echeneis naucrates TaxID=173247 RepID=UPI001113F37D|nr:mRNA decay activator protein ZFP36-like isoform X2 [Echeneis naucrates]
MSEMLDDIFTKNSMKLTLDDGLLLRETLKRSAPFFSPPSPHESSCHSLSSEHVNNDDNGSLFWPSNIWSQGPISKPKQPHFRPDRSMSLTESSSRLLSSFGQMKNLDAFPPAPTTTTVAPPPGFPPSSPFPSQLPPVSSNRYKTELCRGFQETGSCKYGSKCQFAHGEAELRGMHRHPKYKTEPCRTFYNFGYCPYGSRCHFIHEEKITPSAQNPRHQLRQSVSFAGFPGPSRSSSPPSFHSSFNDPNQGFSRAPSVSPPPADLLSPVFADKLQREAGAFQFGNHQPRASVGDIHNIPLIMEPKTPRCMCGHGNNFNSNNSRIFTSMEEEDRHHQDGKMLFPGAGGHGAFIKPAGLQRFSSEDSLEDSYSSSSGGSSGTESPTFDGSATKRLTVFERLSLSD